MLHAILNKKAGRSIQGQEVPWSSLFSGSEDSLTSSIIGTLLYLPTSLFWSILNKAVGVELFSNEIIEKVEFWPFWDAKYTSNADRVEPDVFIRTKEFDLIIEAKRWDGAGQEVNQWKNEIIAYQNEYSEENKKMIFVALGGNSNLEKFDLLIGNNIDDGQNQKYYTIYKCSWLNLLHKTAAFKRKVEKQENKVESVDSQIRILTAVLDYFSVHGFIIFKTFDDVDYPGFSVQSYKSKDLKLNISKTIMLEFEFNYLFKQIVSNSVNTYQLKKIKL